MVSSRSPQVATAPNLIAQPHARQRANFNEAGRGRYFLWEVYEDDLRRGMRALMKDIERNVKQIERLRHESDPVN